MNKIKPSERKITPELMKDLAHWTTYEEKRNGFITFGSWDYVVFPRNETSDDSWCLCSHDECDGSITFICKLLSFEHLKEILLAIEREPSYVMTVHEYKETERKSLEKAKSRRSRDFFIQQDFDNAFRKWKHNNRYRKYPIAYQMEDGGMVKIYESKGCVIVWSLESFLKHFKDMKEIK